MKKQTTAFVMVAVFVFADFGARSGVNALARVRADSREQLVGSWSLVSRVSTLANGEVLPDRGLATIPKGLHIRLDGPRGGAAFAAGAHCGNDWRRVPGGGKNSRDE